MVDNIFKKKQFVILFALIAMFVWGCAYPFIKLGMIEWNIANDDAGGKMLFAGVRFSIAGILTLIIARIKGQKLLVKEKSNIGMLLLFALFNTALHYYCFYSGLAYCEGGKASIINSLSPFLLIILALIIFKEKMTVNKLIGCFLGFSGIIIVNFGTNMGGFSFNGEEHFELTNGQGIMINSKILHRLQSESNAIIPNFLFKPSFIAPEESLIYEKNVYPILSSSHEYIIFHNDIPWQASVLEIMKEIISIQNISSNLEINISMLIQKLWILLCENISFNTSNDKPHSISRNRLQLMMQYIHNHYFENISLENIADAANISKSTALHLFQDNIKITPVNYLISYRLKQAALLLVNTEKKIITISSETGFNNVDHFCRSFKKTYNTTPTTYRNRRSQKG